MIHKKGINDVFLEFNKKNGEIQVSSANVQLGENKATIKGQIEGENNNFIFNHKYLIDGLQNIQSRKIRIEINSSDMPVVLRPEEGDDYLYLIMPIRK